MKRLWLTSLTSLSFFVVLGCGRPEKGEKIELKIIGRCTHRAFGLRRLLADGWESTELVLSGDLGRERRFSFPARVSGEILQETVTIVWSGSARIRLELRKGEFSLGEGEIARSSLGGDRDVSVTIPIRVPRVGR